jgi:hypothetical protein
MKIYDLLENPCNISDFGKPWGNNRVFLQKSFYKLTKNKPIVDLGDEFIPDGYHTKNLAEQQEEGKYMEKWYDIMKIEYQNMNNIEQGATQLEKNLKMYGYNTNMTTLRAFLHIVLKNWQDRIPTCDKRCTIFDNQMEIKSVMNRYTVGDNELQACKKARGWLRNAPKRHKYKNMVQFLEFIWMLRAEIGPNGRVLLDTIAVNLDIILDPRNYNFELELGYEYTNSVSNWKLSMFSLESTTKKYNGLIKIAKPGRPSMHFSALSEETDNRIQDSDQDSSGFEDINSD